MKKIISTILVVGLLSACGISSTPPDSDYDVEGSSAIQEVMRVKVISKKKVQVSSNKLTGKAVGAVIGGIVGRSSGGGKSEKTVGTILGALAGSTIGEAIEGESNKYFATEYVIEDERGDLQAVVVNDDSLSVGDKAFLILSDRPILRKQP